ncbi:MAG: LPS export ABC transporter periplasmic protein LptC [Rickettsiaceae bacterium]|nr:LPS export ABC transporter periplasmic protein LptC [Rickettsiaceae bacterium]
MNQLKHNQNKFKLVKYIFLCSGVLVLIFIFITIIYSSSSSQNNYTVKQDILNNKPYLTKDYSLGIENPVFEGISNNLAPYKILAHTMVKDKYNNYILQFVSGKYLSSDGDIIIKSNEATLDDLAKKIILKDNVLVIFNGIKLKSNQLNLNINNQNINSEAPVIVDFSNSYIKADKLDSDEYSKIIRFKGNVESVFDIDDF